MKKISQNIFCAFCRLERKVYIKKNMNWTNVLLAFFTAVLLMFLVWREIDGRAIIFFVFFISVAEIFVRVRWRVGLTCPHCSFDPLLYKTNREKAVLKVCKKLDEVRVSEGYLLRKNNPLQYLPTIVKSDGLSKSEIRSPQYITPEV